MRHNRKRGATLGLIVATTFLLSIAGMTIVFFCLLMGGARELQNATDSGNLNVAKQSLRYPPLNVFTPNATDLSGTRQQMVQTNFYQCRDSNNQLDLLVFNRVIGQCMLVAINASVDNSGNGPPNPSGITNAKTLLDLVDNDSQGLGTLLATKLATDHQMDLNFSNLAQLASLRMLSNPNGWTNTVTAAKEASYMVPDSASNLVLDPTEIPQAFLTSNPQFLTNNVVTENGYTYLKGYEFVGIPGITDQSTYPLMGVPLCPLLKPHLVSATVFDSQKTPPLANGSNSRIPPNSFRSGGSGIQGLNTGRYLGALSCAITGCMNVNGQFKANIPCGFIVVANGNGATPNALPGQVQVDSNAAGLSANGFAGSGNDIFSDLLMYNTVFVTNNGAMSENAQVIANIQDFKANNPGQSVPANLANALDGPSPKQQYADGIDGSTPAACTNLNSSAGAEYPNSTCIANLPSMASVYNTNLPQQGSGGSLSGLMGLEKEKAEVIDPRPWGGPATVTGVNGACTGLKSFLSPTQLPLGHLPPNGPINFGTQGTIGGLLQGFNGYPASVAKEAQIYTDLTLKIKQIKPSASASEIQAVMNAPLPMGAIRYIWMNDSQTLQVTDGSGLPSWINPNKVLPDGTTITALTGPQAVDGVYVNLDNEDGFPHPWDCPGGPASFQNEVQFTPSSGFNCLQGVLRFQNCDSDGGAAWKCPC